MVDSYPGLRQVEHYVPALNSPGSQTLPGAAEEEDQSRHVVKIRFGYGDVRALLLGDVWHYAACDALTAAGSRKTYTSNKVCLWKQKPENMAAFGSTGKIIKLDRQSVYCLRLDGITKLLKDKNLGGYVHHFEHHERINPPCPQTSPQEGRMLSQAKRLCSTQFVELSEEQEPHCDQHLPIQQVSHSSHAWTVFNPVTGVPLHGPMCASCGVQDLRPAAALPCPLAVADPAPILRTVSTMQRQFQTLMEEMQGHFLQMEDQFKELTTQLRAHFSAVQQQFGALMADHQRRKTKLQRMTYLEEAKRPRKRLTEEKGEQQDEKEKEGNDQNARSSTNSEQAAKRRCDDRSSPQGQTPCPSRR
jgi:hypothetical protein